MHPAILQFGTGRLLQAHADLMLDEALAAGKAAGPVVAVTTSGTPEAAKRAAALAYGAGFPVHIRGLVDGETVDRQVQVTSVVKALDAVTQWEEVRADAVDPQVRAWLSNTADRGYELHPEDDGATPVPRSFPGKLVRLLQARHEAGGAPLSIFPLELITDNGKALRGIVTGLAREWGASAAFLRWLEGEVVFADSLVDRIVSEPIEPVGAVAEPYALWAIRQAPGLFVPLEHPDVVVTEDLERYARLKLFILNLGHTWLAERWLLDRRDPDEIVLQILQDADMVASLDRVYDEEVLPVFVAMGLGEQAVAYRRTVMERFANPFLRHRLADIAHNHAAKKERRFGGLIELSRQYLPDHPTPLLDGALARG
ncbi:mannitol dehydrogenase family protein [Geminicoccus harenae]|uniref:mannitol dehydrogenase family protein n=1 Tax=Geminicoccus harenae TaxID=2498453 RepID=UPI00168B6B65|nr:mannitol dehydrogenase family protein [Geminicoccus harenae]